VVWAIFLAYPENMRQDQLRLVLRGSGFTEESLVVETKSGQRYVQQVDDTRDNEGFDF